MCEQNVIFLFLYLTVSVLPWWCFAALFNVSVLLSPRSQISLHFHHHINGREGIIKNIISIDLGKKKQLKLWLQFLCRITNMLIETALIGFFCLSGCLKVESCTVKHFYPATTMFLHTIATKLRAQHDVRLWVRLKSFCHIIRTENKCSDLKSARITLPLIQC